MNQECQTRPVNMLLQCVGRGAPDEEDEEEEEEIEVVERVDARQLVKARYHTTCGSNTPWRAKDATTCPSARIILLRNTICPTIDENRNME